VTSKCKNKKNVRKYSGGGGTGKTGDKSTVEIRRRNWFHFHDGGAFRTGAQRERSDKRGAKDATFRKEMGEVSSDRGGRGKGSGSKGSSNGSHLRLGKWGLTKTWLQRWKKNSVEKSGDEDKTGKSSNAIKTEGKPAQSIRKHKNLS